MASFLDGLFNSPSAPTAPNYMPFISTAMGNQGYDLGQAGYAGGQAGWITGQYGNATGGYNTSMGGYGNATTGYGTSNAYSSAAQDVANQQLNWARQAYAQNQGQLSPIISSATNYMDTLANNAATDRSFYEGTYQPMMQRYASDAENYASPDRMALMRGRATADVANNFNAARDSSTRQLEDFGINPGATRYGGLDIGVRTQQAAAQAAAANQSDLATEAQGYNLRANAIGMGAVLPGQSVGETNTALSAGALAGNESLALTNSGANTMGTAPTWSGVSQGWGGLGVNYLGAGTGYLGSGANYLNAGTGMSNSGVGWSNSGANWAGVGNSALNAGAGFQNTGFQNSLDSAKFAQNSSSGLGTMLGVGAGLALKYGTGGFGGSGFRFAEGGEVPNSASPSGGRAIDDVPAQLTPGEFVMPRDVVSWMGEEKLQNIVKKARQAKVGAPAKPKTRQALPMGQPSFVSSPHPAIPPHMIPQGAPRQALPVG